METNELYNKAKFYIDKIKKEKPFYFFEHDSSLCLIKSDSQKIFSGTTCVRINDGDVEQVGSDYNAVLSVIAEKKVKAIQMIVISADDCRILTPSADCIQMLIQADEDNAQCEIILSETQTVTASNLYADSADSNSEVDFFSGFDDAPAPEPQDSSEFSESYSDIAPPVTALHSQRNISGQQSSENINNNVMNANPYVSPVGVSRSIHAGSSYLNNSQYMQGSQYVSQYIGSGGNAFRKRLENFLEDDKSDDIPESSESESMSKSELLKQAKKNKKAAKHGLKFLK